MGNDEFWALIGETRRGVESAPRDRKKGQQNRRYLELLSAMTPDQLVGFKRAFEERMREAYTWDLWAAAYIIGGGCSNDGFRDFRAWLIAQGRQTFEAAVRDPETLADYPPLIAESWPDHPSYPAFWSIPWQVYHDKTGEEDFPDLGLGELGKPTGEKFEDDEESLRARHPRLFDRFDEDA
jgi:hypothetical protein